MKLVNMTVKIPPQLVQILTIEAAKSGMTPKQFAGQILLHGYNDLRARANAAAEAKAKEAEATTESTTEENK